MPPNQSKAFVRIYCKIFCDDFPDEGYTEGREASGREIFTFLTNPLGYAPDPETGDPIKRDYALWYLATNEKFGILQCDEWLSEWSFGESNWERVFAFLQALNEKELFSKDQFNALMAIANEGVKAFDDMYLIPHYLKAKKSGKKWIKGATDTKDRMKELISDVHNALLSSGWQVVR